MLEHILITVDGSELSEKAIEYGRKLVGEGGQITLLTVVDLPDIATYSLYPVQVSMDYYNDAMAAAEKGAVDYVDSLAERLRKQGYKVETVVVTGIAADAIVERATSLKVEAIVMSTHGRSGINQWLFGSITQKVLSMMPCPVFVVPGRLVMEQERRATQETEAVTNE